MAEPWDTNLPANANERVIIEAHAWQRAVREGLEAHTDEIEDADDTLEVLFEACPVKVTDDVLAFTENLGYPV